MRSIDVLMKISFRTIALSFILTLALCGCGGSDSDKGRSQQKTGEVSGNDNTLLGAGSTFINPLFSKMFSQYNKSTGLKVNYQSIGSGGGILQITNKTVEFGATDAPLNKEQQDKIGVPMLLCQSLGSGGD